MTAPGLLLVPLSLLLILLPWGYSFVALFVFMMLADVAVVIVGSFGVAPAFFYGNLMIARCAVELAFGRPRLEPRIIAALAPLLFLFGLNIVVLWIALSFFQGEVDVITGTMGFNLNLAQPYHLARENFTQIVYLAFHIVLIYAMAHKLTRIEPGTAAKIVNRAVVSAMVFAIGVVFWEMAAFYGGVPFPTWFFHSDAHSGAWGQVTAGRILRASGSFPEPAGAGFIFAGFLLYAWKQYKLRVGSRVLSMALVLMCLVVLAASTATTSAAAIGFFLAVAAKDLLGAHFRIVGARRGLRIEDFGALAVLGVSLFGIVIYLNTNWEVVDEVLTRAIYEKEQSGSFVSRTSTDLMAIDILFETGGLGIGLGSHKPSSAIMTVLSNTGILGFLTVVLFFSMLLKPYRGRRIQPDPNRILIPLQWLLMGFLFAHCVSNPNINTISIWLVSGLIIGLVAGVERRGAPHPARPDVTFGRSGPPGAGPIGGAAGVPEGPVRPNRNRTRDGPLRCPNS